MKKIKFQVSYEYEIEVDENNDYVKEYKDDQELVKDCIVYDFKPVLPVIEHQGVKLKNVDLTDVSVL